MTYPRLIVVLIAVIVAAMIMLTLTDPGHIEIDPRPVEYYPTVAAEPAQEG